MLPARYLRNEREKATPPGVGGPVTLRRLDRCVYGLRLSSNSTTDHPTFYVMTAVDMTKQNILLIALAVAIFLRLALFVYQH